jgi:hypothetical protein
MKLDNFDFNPVEDKELGLNDYVVDALAAPVRGLEGLARSAYDLGDFLAFDHLPDLDEQRIFGRSATMPGMIIEGITQFAVPFGAIGAGVKVAGAAARVGKLGGVAGKTAKALTKTRKKLSFKGDMAVGAAADFVAFDAQEHRLSNLIQQFPELQNPVSEYLAASPDDTEALGRAKNAIEGLILGGVIGTVGAVTAPVFRTFIAGLDAIKTRNTELEKGATREDATITALMQHQDATKDIRLDEEFAFERRKDAEEFDEIFRAAGGDPEEIPQIDLRTINWDSLEVEELLESTPAMAREEAEAIQAGGVLFFQDETAKTIVKHYQMPNGSRKTILLDINDPSRVYDATNYVERLAEESARGAPGVKAADLDKEFGGINESMKQDFYQKTLVEEVGKRMDSDAPMTVRQALEDIQGRTGGLLNKYAPIVKKLLALGEDTGIDAKLEIRSKAKDLPTTGIRGSFYDSKNRRVVIDAEASSVKNNPVYNILHEATHAVTVDNAVKHYDRAAFNAVDVDNIKGRAAIVDAALNQKDVPKPVAEMLRMFKKADAMRDEIAAKGKLVGTDGKPDLYWIKNPAEFMSFAFTDPQLQQALKGIQYTPKMTMWQKLLNTVKSLFGRGVSTDLMDNIVSRVGEIAEMKLPTQKGRGVDMMPEGVERGVPVDDNLIDNIVKEIDFSTFKVGGAQSVSGVLKSLGKLKLPDGMLMSDLINIQEKLSDRILKEAQKQPKLAQALLDEGVVNEMADAVGADGKFFEGIIAATKKDPTQLMRIASRMKTLEHMLTSNGAQIIDIAKKYKEGRNTLGEEELEILEAQLKGALEQQLVIQSNHSSIASGFGKGLKSRQMNVKMSLSPNELSDAKLRQEYLQRRGGMTTDQMVESILLASDGKGDSMWNAIISMNKLIRGSEGGKMMNMIEEYYKNSIMSAPSSLTINAMGGGIAAGIKNFERYVGGWLGQPPEVRQAVVNSWAQASKYQDIWKFMLKAWKSGDQYIGESGSAFVEQTAKGTLGSITGKNIETSINRAREFTGRGTTELSDATKGFIDYFGNLIRVPNRFNTTVDQMYKFMEYRMRAHANLWIKATDMGLKDPKDIAEYIDKSLNVLLTRSNRTFSKANLIREAEAQFKNLPPVEREKAVHDYVRNAETEAVGKARELGLVGQEGEEFQALQHLARDWVDPNISSADDLTFSKQLGPKMQKVQDLVSGIPFGFVVAPFIRTPTNILKFSFARTLAPAAALKDATMLAISPSYRQRIEALSNGQPGLENLRNSLLEQMKAVNPDGSPDLIARAEARGKLATGTLLNTVLASVVYFQGDRVTGGGPKDFKQRQAWSAAGNMPYSVKIGDKWISYQRLDPVATMIGVYADFKDLMEDGKMHSVDASDFEKFAAASTLVLTRNATNKSYLTGIDKFFSMIFDPDSTSAGETAGSMVGGFVPNILSKGQSITGDQELKEIRGFADAILKRFPGTNLDLKRNPLGEPVVQEYFEGVAGILNPANPMIWGSAKDDPVLLELANVGHGFSAPSTKLEGILDLTDFQGSNKRSAYDRWLELQGEVKINNKTLRQTLLKLIKSKGYQSLSDETYSGLPSPRVEYISKVLSRFRSRAKMQMLDEFPEIKEQLRRVKTAKKGLKGGMQGEDVLALLAQ